MGEEKRRITIEDVLKIKYVEDPRISPDGKWIAYVVMSANPMEKRYDRDIYIVASDGSRTIRLTRNGKNTSPRWSPASSQLAFVSTRNDKPQIYVLPVAHAGEARVLTSHENGAHSPAWSPDGKHIAYLSASNVDERQKEDSGETEDAPERYAGRQASFRA